VNAFYRYLTDIGFDLPKDAPPLGVSAGVSFGSVTPGTVYDASMFIPGDGIDNLDNVTNAYSLFLFSYLLQRVDLTPDAKTLIMRSVWIFANYYRASFVNSTVLTRNPRQRNWKLRCGTFAVFTGRIL